MKGTLSRCEFGKRLATLVSDTRCVGASMARIAAMRCGFAGLALKACGLTRGGFYAHFSSKGQLYCDALNHGDSIDAVLGEYIGTPETASAKLSPAFAFLAVDVASKTPEVRAAFTDVFTSISEKLLCHLSVNAQSAESCSLSTAALIVGALAVANTTDNPDLKAKLLASCKENAGPCSASMTAQDRSSSGSRHRTEP